MTARIAPLAPPYDVRAAEDLHKLMPPGVPPIALFRTVARNPRVLRRLRRGGLLDPGSISVRQRELIILRTTALARAEYEWGVHAAFFAGAAGFDATHLYATVWSDADSACWQPDEALLVRACDELHTTARVSDPTWTALAHHFDEAQLIEIVMLAGQYRGISYVVNATGVALEPAARRFPPESP
jgi:alkylhydroperoxidase family enzyme